MFLLRIIIISFFSIISMRSFSQDIIIKNDKSEIKAKVLELTDDEIKYSKFENPNGPVYSIKKSMVFVIFYHDGTKEYIKGSNENAVVSNKAESNSFVFIGYTFSGVCRASNTNSNGRMYTVSTNDGSLFIVSFGPITGAVNVTSQYYKLGINCGPDCNTAVQITVPNNGTYIAESGTLVCKNNIVTFDLQMKILNGRNQLFPLKGSFNF